MNRAHIKKCISDALDEVYSISPGRGCQGAKSQIFIELAVKRIFGEDIPKVPPPPPAETPEEGGVFYKCDTCGKKCSTTSGLTLHKKKHAAKEK